MLVLLYVAISRLGHLSTNTSGYLLRRRRKMPAYMYLNIQHWYRIMSEVWRKQLHWWKPICVVVFSNLYSCVFSLSVFVGSSAAESMSNVSHLGRMENDVNLYFPPNPLCFCLVYCYISLLLRVSVWTYSRMDFAVKTSGRMISDVVHIQLNTSLYSQFTALQGHE